MAPFVPSLLLDLHAEDERHPPVEPATLRVALRFRGVLEALGLDLEDPNLAGTEHRVARAYGELLAGLRPGAEPALRTFPNGEGYSETVMLTDITFYSLCAHHFLPFFGVAHVAYVPRDRVVGLSKLGRVVELFARRPQLQERLTEQVVEFLDRRLRPKGVMAVVEARHLCMEMRGLSAPGIVTTTAAARGVLARGRRRREFLEALRTRMPRPAGFMPSRLAAGLRHGGDRLRDRPLKKDYSEPEGAGAVARVAARTPSVGSNCARNSRLR